MEIRADRVYEPFSSDASVTATRADSTALARTVVATGAAAPSGTLQFNGDYSTNNFSQWPLVQNKNYNGNGAGYTNWFYGQTIINDATKGPTARYEVRSGDYPGFPSGDRAQVGSNEGQTGGGQGATRWYKFAVRFDASFPQNHADLGFGVSNGWHPNSSTGSSPFQWALHWNNGYWSLLINVQTAPGVYVRTDQIWRIPLGTAWHNIKMEVFFHTSITTGWLRLWYNDVRQTFLNGSQTYFCSTLVPQTTNVYYKEGYYRDYNLPPTGILYCTDMRCATTESALGT